jgi:hypothetical protein
MDASVALVYLLNQFVKQAKMGELKFTALLDASLNPEGSAAIEQIASNSRITRQPHCTAAAISLLLEGNTCDLS